jgi:NitT/TauT family transport system ATP-binding protein
MTTKLRVESVSKRFQVEQSGGGLHALDAVSFDVREREFVVLIGPSGCGKSTLLKIVHGLVRSDGGAVFASGQEVKNPTFDRALVFQNAGLLPWRTAQKNVELGLEAMGVAKAKRTQVASDCLNLVGLRGFEGFFPHQLSGGMQQRVGLGRALAVDPEILLMDEPFGALDAQTRERLQQELMRIHSTTQKTVLFVTHDLDEAVYLADRIVVMSAQPGRVSAIVDVPLPRPRGLPAAVRGDAAFVETRRRLWDLLSQVNQA